MKCNNHSSNSKKQTRLKHHHCKVEGCNNSGVVDPRRGKAYFPNGFCNMHYKRWAAHGDPLVTHKHRSRRVYENHPLLFVWRSIRNRCVNPKSKYYSDYGGRGITLCLRWQGVAGFSNFVSDMGERPSKKHSIDRINNEGPYSPENCQWATMHQQTANRRGNNVCVGVSWITKRQKWSAKITVDRKTHCLGEFIDLQEAILARKNAELKFNITYNHDTRNTTPKI